MRREQAVAMANASMSRKLEREALAKGDAEGAAIQAGIAADFESDADFWGAVADEEVS